MPATDPVLAYHERSKHHLDRYAPGPGHLDWASQPEPFREFDGARRFVLPLVADSLSVSYGDVRAGRLHPPQPFELRHVAALLELALGLSAWKSYGGNRWALRCNPSSGNLHPTEAYLVLPHALPDRKETPLLPAGVYHYVSRDHALEQRAALKPGTDPHLTAGDEGPSLNSAAGDEGPSLNSGLGDEGPSLVSGFFVGLTSIHWREAWKYGMRAWRYCQHDCGHAIAALAYAAAALGWQARVVGVADDDCGRLLGLAREADFGDAEREAPEALLWVGDPGAMPEVHDLRAVLEAAPWTGRANRLSASHVDWPDITRIESATRRPFAHASVLSPRSPRQESECRTDLPFATIARQRRSAVDFDGVTSIGQEAFCAMLDRTMPSAAPPWNAWPGEALVHPALMVHRVDGLEAGLYMLVREAQALEPLKAAMRPEWLWRKAGPAGLPLYLLLPHDLRAAARLICCHQDIAADSCFALGMVARFEAARAEPWRYRELFWEAGMLGQVLYLEAEAAGVRATGIGCYFDDEMHRLLGLAGSTWQSLYHFTIGGPVEDPRLVTLPPYQGRAVR